MSKEQPKTNKSPEKIMTDLLAEVSKLKDQLKKTTIAHEEALRGKQEAIADNVRLRQKLADYEQEKVFLVRAGRINKIVNLMIEKGMLAKNQEAVTTQMKSLAEMDDKSLESWKRVVIASKVQGISTEEDSPSTKKAFSNVNQTFFMADSDEKTMGTMQPPTLSDLFDQLPWNNGLPNK